MNTTIGIAADHAGFELKQKIKTYLTQKGFTIKDFGTHDTASMDYPDVVHPLCNAIGNNEFEKGILICGSAQGVSMTANKHSFIRAAICWNVEIATLTRQHNNANIICLPARFIDEQTAEKCVDAFFATAFEGGRHQNRVNKISVC
ncbi:MAG: ribose 5-phosphate isomerase [Bacteroidota bacterium]|jgi:ribose 5-phosphate isomerase B